MSTVERSVHAIEPYPEGGRERDQWILVRRPVRNSVDPRLPYAFFAEEERAESGKVVPVATIFLTNRECPWRCLMCDLWRNTLTETVSPGAIPAQIDFALTELSKQRSAGFQPASSADIRVAGSNREQRRSPESQAGMSAPKMSLNRHSLSPRPSPIRWERGTAGEGEPSGSSFSTSGAQLPARMAAPRQIKLYNSGSFFDPRAIPPEDYEAIAGRLRAFERVIVECHPALIGKSALQFRDLLQLGGGHKLAATAKLEVAMGLETTHPAVLKKLNKRMTLEQFRRAAEFLSENEIALRVFILVQPPFLDEAEALRWANRSIDSAFDCGATAVSLIPTRFGNGALETLAERSEFSPPRMVTLEAALDYGIGLQRGRVFADLWELLKFSDCPVCFDRRRARLREMNLGQVLLPRVVCGRCENQGSAKPRPTGL